MLAVWLVNFQIIARAAFPWFLATPQIGQVTLHAVFYGLPVAWVLAASQRRLHRIGRPAPRAV